MKSILITLISLLFFVNISTSQTNNLPSTKLKDLDGRTVSLDSLPNNTIYVVSFWATWCKPCKQELNNLSDNYDYWSDTVDFRVIAISVDDQKTIHQVSVEVYGKGWPFEVWLDKNQDLTRQMGVSSIPHTFVIKNKQIVYNHIGYSNGDEDLLYEFLKELSKK